jgi:hypothetical protein
VCVLRDARIGHAALPTREEVMMTAESITTMMEDQLKMLEALYEICMSSTEAEMVRVAIQALTSTQAGMTFLQTHPITL